MASAVQKLRGMLNSGPTHKNLTNSLDPELGFKVAISEANKELNVTVIAARHLPTIYGLTRVKSYVVKVKLFPGKEKFETKEQKESWPSFNQEFTFKLATNSNRIEDQLCGKFIVLTMYALLEDQKEKEESSFKLKNKLSSNSFTSFSFLSKFDGTVKRSNSKASDRVSLNKRRTVGAITYNLDAKAFTQRLRNNCLGTPDVWRTIKIISSGLVDSNKSVDNNKGTVELTMNYSVSEDGKHDMISLSLSRLRFSIATMEHHENYTGSLYVKIKIYECDVIVGKWRSNQFEPTISLKLDPVTATVVAVLNNSNLSTSRCEVRLMCKNKLGKKSELGNLIIGPKDGHWTQVVDMPSTPVTMWHNFR